MQRQGNAVHNFERALPAPQSELAAQILKDPYNFDFLSLGQEAHERDLERGLLEHLKSFLLELGAGFAFVGSQHHLEVNGKDYFLDLLFYHYRLHCFFVIDLSELTSEQGNGGNRKPPKTETEAPEDDDNDEQDEGEQVA